MPNLSPAEEDAITELLDRTKELINLNKLDEADKFLNEIEKYKPDDWSVPFQRGTIFVKRRELEKALEQFLLVYEQAPDFFYNLNNIGTQYFNLGKYIEAADFYKRALSIRPDSDMVLGALGNTLFRLGRLKETISYIKQSVEISGELSTHSNLLLVMIYADSISPEELAEEARNFGNRLEGEILPRSEFTNDRSKKRRLRVGYVSPDFRDHPVPFFLEPLLKSHDREHFEVYAYSSTPFENPIMERMKKSVDHWRDIYPLKEPDAREVIMNDEIDILIDVAGHTSHNKLGVFSLRAAPIQITWLGYTATTGVKAMDYRITDIHAEPIGMTEHLNTETLWRLPNIFAAYAPGEDSPDVIDHPPYEDNGYITFGCFNNFIKVRDETLAIWAEILKKVPGSKIIFEIEGIADSKIREDVLNRLNSHDYPMDRVILEIRKRSNQYILYNKIDIALDPFPCVGGTTSMDTVWMGVPFITLAGKHFASRMGVSILTNAGLPGLIAQNTKEYVAIAVELASERKTLKAIRHNLREKFAASPAMDQKQFTHDMEKAYREMWERYCDTA